MFIGRFRSLSLWTAFMKGTCAIFVNRHILRNTPSAPPCCLCMASYISYFSRFKLNRCFLTFEKAAPLVLKYVSCAEPRCVCTLLWGKWPCLSIRVCNKEEATWGTKKGKKKSVQHKLNLLLRYLFHLKVTFTHFLVFLSIASCTQGSCSVELLREHAGPEDREGAHCCKVPPCRFISPF